MPTKGVLVGGSRRGVPVGGSGGYGRGVPTGVSIVVRDVEASGCLELGALHGHEAICDKLQFALRSMGGSKKDLYKGVLMRRMLAFVLADQERGSPIVLG